YSPLSIVKICKSVNSFNKTLPEKWRQIITWINRGNSRYSCSFNRMNRPAYVLSGLFTKCFEYNRLKVFAFTKIMSISKSIEYCRHTIISSIRN
ncbi:MAG TPA: hypothetical protein VJP58_05305, partial [Candidatus Nitrosocosmicus sp.]|nr:hypothetical protein [Candidatus Nitrosocosmicus sp.]